MRFIVLVTTDLLLNLHQSPFEFDFSRVTIFGLIKFRHLGPPIRRMVGMIIPTTVSSVTKAEQHGLQGVLREVTAPPPQHSVRNKDQILINLFIAQVCGSLSAIIMLVSLFVSYSFS